MGSFECLFIYSIPHGGEIILLLTVIMHIAFASCVGKDINNLHKLGVMTQLFAPWLWILATLILGIIPAVIYWLMHHSTLARRN